MFSIIWGILEIFRVQNGYEGNIRESVLLNYSNILVPRVILFLPPNHYEPYFMCSWYHITSYGSIRVHSCTNLVCILYS